VKFLGENKSIDFGKQSALALNPTSLNIVALDF
jgi:hypothetical protein